MEEVGKESENGFSIGVWLGVTVVLIEGYDED